VIRRGDPNRRVVALTFDAGSDVGYTDAILDTLRAQGIHATFSLTGQWTTTNPAAARRIVAEGHQLMNHTQDHLSFTGASTGKGPLSSGQRIAELQTANTTIASVTGVDTRPWFRPAYGDTDVSVQRDAASAGYGYEVMWTLDSLGWNGLPSGQITTRCLNAAQPGAIYLFHVGSASQDSAALPAIIAGLRSAGYDFVTIAQMVTGT
jgi:peptidoglycan/xylan/chitin deacetylase (PgdA/CDA1 family)